MSGEREAKGCLKEEKKRESEGRGRGNRKELLYRGPRRPIEELMKWQEGEGAHTLHK